VLAGGERCRRWRGTHPEGGAVRLLPCPGGVAVKQLRPGGGHDQQGERAARRRVDQAVKDIEQELVGPVQVLQREHQRLLVGQRAQQPSPRRYYVAAFHLPAGLQVDPRSSDTDQGAKLLGDPCRRRTRDDPRDRLGELALGRGGQVAVQDSRLRLDQLDQRPKGPTVDMGLRPAGPPHRRVGLAGNPAAKLGQQPTLADPGSAHQRHQLRPPALTDALVAVQQRRQLTLPANQRNPEHREGCTAT